VDICIAGISIWSGVFFSAITGLHTIPYVLLFYWGARLDTYVVVVLSILVGIFQDWLSHNQISLYLISYFVVVLVASSEFLWIASRRLYEQLLLLAAILISISGLQMIYFGVPLHFFFLYLFDVQFGVLFFSFIHYLFYRWTLSSCSKKV
jgi:hypothetical protein